MNTNVSRCLGRGKIREKGSLDPGETPHSGHAVRAGPFNVEFDPYLSPKIRCISPDLAITFNLHDEPFSVRWGCRDEVSHGLENLAKREIGSTIVHFNGHYAVMCDNLIRSICITPATADVKVADSQPQLVGYRQVLAPGDGYHTDGAGIVRARYR